MDVNRRRHDHRPKNGFFCYSDHRPKLYFVKYILCAFIIILFYVLSIPESEGTLISGVLFYANTDAILCILERNEMTGFS